MQILRYEPDMARELMALYNAATDGVPHCYPLADETELAAVLAHAVEGVERNGTLSDDAVFVARDGGTMKGYVHVGRGAAPTPGVIRFLAYSRGERAAGQQVLEAAHRQLRDLGVESSSAFPQEYRYPFYHLKSAYLSERMDHVQALLSLNGYRVRRGEVYLDWPNLQPPALGEPWPGIEIEIEHKPGAGRLPGVIVKARRDGEDVGECQHISGGECSRADEAQEWAFCSWLGVEEAFQGKGFGLYLLRAALRECHSVGYRHAAISTALDNYRAFVFYSNHGYRMSDWTYGMHKDLETG
jgi:GNAT superfamily N-acetyltransferase